ncbi:hypothetical protein NOVOSPHI9U_130009 [Novosphingobium sp. 9U]|nr:hypothetical protein NOVOSPHI9U_130009 [Novosphingobium sp. 9U]
MAGQPGFFDLSDRYEALSAAGDPLERLAAVVDFEVFRGPLVAALRLSPRGNGGRPPFDPESLVFLDETWVNTKMARLYGWSPVGERCHDKAPFRHWKTMTFVAGLRLAGMTAP